MPDFTVEQLNPRDLTPNPLNWRRHPQTQREVLAYSLEKFGFVQGVVLNKQTGNLIDGHARVEEAIEQGRETIPVNVVDLSEEDERELLRLFDPIGALAETDTEALDRLIAEIGNPDLEAMLAGMEPLALAEAGGGDGVGGEQARQTLAERFGVPPFSVLDARQGYWQARKKAWIALGIQSELGRGENTLGLSPECEEYRGGDYSRSGAVVSNGEGGLVQRRAAARGYNASPGGSPRGKSRASAGWRLVRTIPVVPERSVAVVAENPITRRITVIAQPPKDVVTGTTVEFAVIVSVPLNVVEDEKLLVGLAAASASGGITPIELQDLLSNALLDEGVGTDQLTAVETGDELSVEACFADRLEAVTMGRAALEELGRCRQELAAAGAALFWCFHASILSQTGTSLPVSDAASLGTDGKTRRGDGKGKPLARTEGSGGPGTMDAQRKEWREEAKGGLTWPGKAAEFDGYRVQEGLREETQVSGTSIFDPVLCELAYRWFCPEGGRVLDPFAGGSVRGIVAGMLGRDYVGVDLSGRQLEANREQADQIGVAPEWIDGDSRELESLTEGEFDFLFSCPPYADLEVYSDDPRDLSTLDYPEFLATYRQIIAAAVGKLKENRFACFVVGDVRDPKGFYRGFVGDTIEAFEAAGMTLYNDAVLVTAVGSLPIRVGKQFGSYRKLGKTHQNVLVFYNGDPRRIKEISADCEFGELAEEGAVV